MNKYKSAILITRSLQLIIIVLTLGLIFIPIYHFSQKESKDLNLSLYTNDQDQYQWFLEHEKINLTNDSDSKIIIINKESDFDQTFTENLKHELVIYDHLYTAIDEIPYKRDLLESVSGIVYSGYMGKTYPALENVDDIPAKIIENYQANTGLAWNFQGEGIILQKASEIIVLLKGKDYTETITLEVNGKHIPYWGSFEVTSGGISSSVEATFKFHPTEVGKNRLNAYGLSTEFPALYQMNTPLLKSYYIAGDFSNFEVNVPYYHDSLPSILSSKGLFELYSLEQPYWQWFYPMLSNTLNDTYQGLSLEQSESPFYIEGTDFYKTSDQTPFFITGVNLGAALPNKAFTEFPMSFDTYYTWLEEIHDLNVNTVRIYTLLPPVFYEALYQFNRTHQEDPLYLLQEIWPEENPENSDYLAEDYNDIYHLEIEYVVNAIHGNENIPFRNYRAYGLYQYDVSPYVLGFLVGRELEPEEVEATDELNEGYRFQGDYLYGLSTASPTENWLAAACDYTMQIASQYGTKPLVGIVNWPTLDPLDHDSEWNEEGDKSLQYNDSVVVDINQIGIHSENMAGFFGAYHIYPNYPDFMNNDEAYDAYEDDQGRFRYGGYLEDFMTQHQKYPAVVAEYGISTSMYTAHFSPDGYDHGGLTEQEQAEGIIRMTNAIQNEGYGGAIIFEWIDEWTKKTWTTEPYMIPYASNAFWHNIMDPEQNYGLVKFTSDLFQNIKTAYRNPSTLGMALSSQDPDKQNDLLIEKVAYAQDYQAIYLYIDYSGFDFNKDPLTLKISTPSEIDSLEDFWEFYIELNPVDSLEYPNADLYVNPGYNWPFGRFTAVDAPLADYTVLNQLVNNENTSMSGTYISAQYESLGTFDIGSIEDQHSQIQIDEDQVIIRLPYGLLGISDPRSLQILSDATYKMPTTQDTIDTKEIESIHFELVTETETIDMDMPLTPWVEAETQQSFKESYWILSDYFKNMTP